MYPKPHHAHVAGLLPELGAADQGTQDIDELQREQGEPRPYSHTMAVPKVIWIPCLMSEDDDHSIHQGGGFDTEAEAQEVLDIWRSEGRREPMAINSFPFYGSVDEWNADR